MELAPVHVGQSPAGYEREFLLRHIAAPHRVSSSANKGKAKDYTLIQPTGEPPLQDVTMQAFHSQGPCFLARMQAIHAKLLAPVKPLTEWYLGQYAARRTPPPLADQPRRAWASAKLADIARSGMYAGLGPNAATWQDLGDADFSAAQNRAWVVPVLKRAQGDQYRLLKLRRSCLGRVAERQDAESGGCAIRMGHNGQPDSIGGYSVAEVWVGVRVKGEGILYQPYALLWNPGESKAHPWQVDSKNPYVFAKHDGPTVYQWACFLLGLPATQPEPHKKAQDIDGAADTRSALSSGSNQTGHKRQLSGSDQHDHLSQGGQCHISLALGPPTLPEVSAASGTFLEDWPGVPIPAKRGRLASALSHSSSPAGSTEGFACTSGVSPAAEVLLDSGLEAAAQLPAPYEQQQADAHLRTHSDLPLVQASPEAQHIQHSWPSSAAASSSEQQASDALSHLYGFEITMDTSDSHELDQVNRSSSINTGHFDADDYAVLFGPAT